MLLMLSVLVALSGCLLGKALHPLESDRCLGEPLQSIRKRILEELNIQQAPQLEGSRMSILREKLKAAFKTNVLFAHVPSEIAEDKPEAPSISNTTELQCCQLSSQIFIKDLGWENWVIYPESFTFTQCSACNPKEDLTSSHCSDQTSSTGTTGATSQVPESLTSTAHYVLPFLYLDDLGSMVISPVRLTRECGCGLGLASQIQPHPPQP
uniref:TGF-beta family profile domain-containing protein n=1 Tax=Denticeps clupeoides TaxID=299321 RepID=A0AAY4EST8_9TELE